MGRYQARYRCCWCGSYSGMAAKETQKHMIKMHRRQLEFYLHPILSVGVSGEGDSA